MQKEQFIRIKESGNKESDNKAYYSDREMTIRHREDGPAIEYADGSKAWYLNGERHREDGPAYEDADGSREWFINGKHHREDGPAIEYADGSKAWYLNGERHREDGPAVEGNSRYKAWYINGEQLSEDEFNTRTNPVTELTLDEIASKFGVNVSKLKIKK